MNRSSLEYFDELVAWAFENPSSRQVQQSPFANILVVNPPSQPTISNSSNATSSQSQSRIRIGRIEAMLLSQPDPVWGDLVAALLAVRDFNQRSCPYDDLLNQELQACDFYFTIRAPPPSYNLMHMVHEWQESVLYYEYTKTPLRPLAVVGGITSTASSLLASVGAAASIIGNTSAINNTVTNLADNPVGVPNISPASTSSSLDQTQEYPMFVRTIPSNQGDAQALVAYLHTIGIQYLSVLYGNDDYGRNFFLNLIDAAAPADLKISPFNYFADIPGDLSETIQQLKASQLRHVFCIVPFQSDWTGLFGDLVDANLLGNPEYAFYFSDSMDYLISDQHNLAILRNERLARALNHSAVVSVQVAPGPFVIHERQMQAAFQDETFLKYMSSIFEPQQWSPHPFQPSGQFYTTITTPLAYDAAMALGVAACRVSPTATSSSQSPFFSAPEYVQALKAVQFHGASGYVQFNRTTGSRLPDTVHYGITNVLVLDGKEKGTFVSTAGTTVTVFKGNVSLEHNLTFASGLTVPPLDLRQVTINQLFVPLGTQIFIGILAATVFVLSWFCILWTIRFRKKPTVQASQPFFLVFAATGPVLISIAMMLNALQPPGTPQNILDGACMAKPWLLDIGQSLTLSALFAKTWRINQVYRNAMKFRRVQIRPKDVLWPCVLLLGTQLIILTCWTILAPLHWEYFYLYPDSYGRDTAVTGGCSTFYRDHQDNPKGAAFYILSIVVSVVALILLNYQSWRAQGLPTEFGESGYIALTNFIMLETFFIGIPIYFMTGWDNPSAAPVVSSVLYSIFSLGILLPLFVPKWITTDERRRVVSMSTGLSDQQGGSFTKSVMASFMMVKSIFRKNSRQGSRD